MNELIYQAGIGVLLAHCTVYAILKYVLPKGPWTSCPSFTAHQIVCFPLMLILTGVGFYAWFFDTSSNNFTTPQERCLNEYAPGLFLGRLAMGMQLFWDIPTGIVTPQLFDPIMLLHHIGMTVVSGIVDGLFSNNGLPVAAYHATFFLGVIEISSIPLVIVDLFHPKNKEWCDYHMKYKSLISLNEISRIIFAALYLIIRAVYFPYVGFRYSVPDFYYMAQLPTNEERNGISSTPFYILLCIFVPFCMLQMFWGYKVFQQVLKVLKGPSGEDEKGNGVETKKSS